MSLSKAVTIDWCHGSHKSVNTLISREPETTMPFTAWAIQMDKPLLHKWGTDQKLTLNEVWKTWKNRYLLVPLHRFHGSVNPTKSGPGLRKLQKYQADSVNVCQHILFKFNLQALSLFQEPNLQRNEQVADKVRETHPSAESWPRHPGTEPFHAAHTDVHGIYSLFSLSTPSTTLHSMGNPAWDWLSASCWTSTAALRGQQSAQPLSSGFCNSQHGLFSF